MKTYPTNCPLCGSPLIAHSRNAASNIRDVEDELIATITSYARCLGCGVEFQNPMPSIEELNEWYASGEYRDSLEPNKEEMDKDEQRRAEYIARAVTKTPASHLDLGCSRGYLLKKIGAERMVGVDLNTAYCEYSDIEMYSSLDEVSGKFELITIIHELEHEIDPLSTLKKVKKLLKGNLLIEVPSQGSPGGPYRPAHTYVFEPWSLISLIERAGLKTAGITLTPHILVSVTK